VSSLSDLPRSIEPPRDLWAGIEARIAAEGHQAPAMDAPSRAERPSGRRGFPGPWLQGLAAAAMVACLAVGIWIGRSVLPGPARPGAATLTSPGAVAPGNVQAAYVTDPRYQQQRAALLQSLQSQLASLRPDVRAKVLASLATIHQSMQDLQAALGRDPSNALLQELLVNTYHDEMRVLTAVHEAGEAGKGI
jgi:hypothetical protein